MTLKGLLTLIVMSLAAIASFTSESNLLLLMFGIALGVVGFNLVSCVRTVRNIEVQRITPTAVIAGRPFRIAYIVRSRRRWLRCWAVRIGETPVGREGPPFEDVFVTLLGPGEESRLEVTTVCPSRQRIRLSGIRVSCGFPFGLFSCRVDVKTPTELLVYPVLGRVRREFWHQQALAETSQSRRNEAGSEQNEFHGVREYRQGDNPRWIHWRRSARTGQLVVREHQALRDTQLMILLAPWPELLLPLAASDRRGRGWGRSSRAEAVVCGPSAHPYIERLISAAATAACEVLDRGHRVGLIAAGRTPVLLPPVGGRAQRQRILNELALLEPTGRGALEELVRAMRWQANWHARAILFTAQPEDTHSHLLRILAGRSEAITVVSPQSGRIEKLFELPMAGHVQKGE